MPTFYKFLFHSLRFYRNSPGFLNFQELCPIVPRNSVRGAKFPDFFQALKIRYLCQYVRALLTIQHATQ